MIMRFIRHIIGTSEASEEYNQFENTRDTSQARPPETQEPSSTDLENANLDTSPQQQMTSNSENKEAFEEPVAINTPSTNTTTAWQIVANLGAIIFAKENRRYIYAAGLLTTLNSALNLVAPYLIGEQFDAIANNNDPSVVGLEVSVQTMTLLLIGVGLCSQCIPNFRDQLLVSVAANSTREILIRATDQQLTRNLEYHNRAQFGEKFYLLQKSFACASTATPLLTQILPTFFEISVAIGVLSYQFGEGMGGGIAGIGAAFAIYSGLTTKSIIETREGLLQKGNFAMQKMSNAIKQYKNVYDFCKYSYEMKAVQKAVNEAAAAEIKAMTAPLKVGLGHIVIPRVGMLIACLYIANHLASGQFSAQDFTFMYIYLDKLSTLLPAVGMALNSLFASYPDLRFVFRELLKPSEVIDAHPDNKLIIDASSASIRFENVTVGYPGKPPLFRNLSLLIKPGESVAIVGKTGCGKSTIFKLLYGYLAPTSGKIYINDQDISTVSLHSLQMQLGSIAQTANLFNGSVRDNIRYGAPDPDAVTDQQIWEVAEKVHLKDFLLSLDRGYKIEPLSNRPKDKDITEETIFLYVENNIAMYACKLPKSDDFPDGKIIRTPIINEHDPDPIAEKLAKYFITEILNEYPFPMIDHDEKNEFLDLLLTRNHIVEKRLDNSVGEDGKKFSGGEQQRVAILRGLFKSSARIWMFDEITSALDSLTADIVLEYLENLTKSQTRLAITHKLAETMHADKIIVLHRGRVLAQGKHDELLQTCCLYQDLWNKQNKPSPVTLQNTMRSTAAIADVMNIHPAQLLTPSLSAPMVEAKLTTTIVTSDLKVSSDEMKVSQPNHGRN